MRDVILYMSMSLDGFVGSDRAHPGMAIPEGPELKQWKLAHARDAGQRLLDPRHAGGASHALDLQRHFSPCGW